jgi:hypothetical protein
MSNQDPPETVRLTLSPLDGRRLFGFLTELAQCGDSETDVSGLDELLDKVGDANALALWLRENVNVELEGPDVSKVRKMLESMSSKQGVAPEADSVLPAMQEQLAEYLPEGHWAVNTN